MKTLVIAEKPSVAKDIAQALNAPRIGQGIYENQEVVISHCIGHLVEITAPEADDRNAPLPIIPERFKLKAISKTREQFLFVKKLMHRPDIKSVANACDAGREGEAIFRLTYELAGCEKPMERLWLQSMTKNGMLAAWKNREPGARYDNLADASRCRAESDWLFGINGSRAAYSAVGRVMTPTLAMVVRRYLEHTQFKSRDFFELHGTFAAKAGQYVGKWVPAKNRDASDTADNEDTGSRFNERAKAEAILALVQGRHPERVTDNAKPTRSAPPLLYDLTSLQREANKVYKFSAKKTLQIAQDLYEKFKATTYPRTDSKALPEDYVGKCQAVVDCLSKVPAYRPHAERILKAGWVKPNKRIFNNAKISDHFAIIPTGVIASGMDADTAKLYQLIVLRFLAVFHPDAEYLETRRITIVNGEHFQSNGKVLTSPGWRLVYGGLDDEDKKLGLPPINKDESVKTVKIEVKTCKTSPPALHTEASLLQAMETAGKTVDDEELAEAMKERGLGTPATRAATIEKLLDTKGYQGKTKVPYVKRDKANLVPTQKGIDLIAYLDRVFGKLTNPAMTGEWEYQLRQMEKGQVAKKEFMLSTYRQVKEMVESIKQSPPPRTQNNATGAAPTGPSVGACPACDDGKVQEGDTSYGCSCGFLVPKVLLSKKLPKTLVKELLARGKTDRLDGFVSNKSGKSFSAALKVNRASKRIDFDF